MVAELFWISRILSVFIKVHSLKEHDDQEPQATLTNSKIEIDFLHETKNGVLQLFINY